MEVNVRSQQLVRWGAVLLLVIALLVAAFLAREQVTRLLSGGNDAPSTAEVQDVVRDYLDGRLAPNDPHITERMAADVEKLAQLPHGEFIAFEEPLRVIARVPEDAPTRARLVGTARYRAPAGSVFLGEITVEAVKEGDAWKVDRILVRPIANVEP